MSRRSALLVAALALVVLIVAIWFARGKPEPPRDSRAHAARPHDEAFAQRMAAIRKASASLASTLPRFQLRGRVIDSAGTPVPDAVVAIGEPAVHVRSGAKGEFSIANLMPGRYAVEARKGPLVGGPLAVQLSADREITVVLRRGAELRVEVVSTQDGTPVPNADVKIALLSMYDHGGEQQARTDAAGIATFEGVTLVAHTIWVGAEGFVEKADTVDPMHVEGTALRMRIELAPGITVRGRVVDADTGQPIEGAVIESLRGDHREGARRGDDRARHGDAPPYALEARRIGTATDKDGRFRIGVTKGPWTIVATHRGYATAGSFIAVTDSPLEVQLSLTKGQVVHGVVVTESDLPVPGAEVEARWQFGGRIERTTRADGRGRFALVGLPAAPLELIARAADGTSTPKRMNLAEPRLDDEDVLLVLDNTGAITGRVVRAGEPVPAAQIFFVEQGVRAKLHPGVVNADDSGAFRIAGVARDRTYVLNAMPHQDGDSWFRAGSTEAKAGADVTIEIPPDGTLRGRVEAPGRLVEINVELEGNTPPRPLEASGKFVFRDIPPGPRTLLFTGPRIAEHRMTTELKPGQDLDLGTIQLAGGRTIAGKVVGEKDEPMADAELIVRADGSSELRGGTTHEGTFSLVAPADRELVVEARSRRGGMARIVVPAKGPSDALVLKLGGGATLEGSVTYGDDPLGEAVVELRKVGDKADRPYSYTQTDSSGYFRLVSLEPGPYELVMIRNDADAGSGIEYVKSIEIKGGANYANTDLKQLTPR